MPLLEMEHANLRLCSTDIPPTTSHNHHTLQTQLGSKQIMKYAGNIVCTLVHSLFLTVIDGAATRHDLREGPRVTTQRARYGTGVNQRQISGCYTYLLRMSHLENLLTRYVRTFTALSSLFIRSRYGWLWV